MMTVNVSMARSTNTVVRDSIKRRRITMGYTQDTLAEALRVDRATVSRWERGAQCPHPYNRRDLARLLRVTLEQLEEMLFTA
jgi:DNA-binding XRE family transcriptional regulator